jgi:membrane protein
MKNRAISFYRIWVGAINYFIDIDGPVRASALAYTTLLALVPLSVLGLGIMSAFPIFNAYIDRINKFLFRHFVPSSADIVQAYVEKFADISSRLSIISFVFSLLTALMLLYAMQNSFDAIWHVKKREGRYGLSAFLKYWAILTLLPLVSALALATSIYFSSLPHVSLFIDTVARYFPVNFLISLIFSWVSFWVLYVILPQHKIKIHHAALGALCSAFLFECVKQIFNYYINNISNDKIIYGAIAAIPTFLLWLYISWIIILFGATLSYSLARDVENYPNKKN